jgi:hypothetical protein
MTDGYGEFPSSGGTSAVVDRNLTEPSVYRWRIESVTTSGQGFVPYLDAAIEAIRIAPMTTVVLRGITIETLADTPALPFRVLADVFIGKLRAEELLGHPAMLYSGEVVLHEDWERVIERELRPDEQLPIDVRVLCVKSVSTTAHQAGQRK